MVELPIGERRLGESRTREERERRHEVLVGGPLPERGAGVEECRLAFMAAMDLIEEKCGISLGEGKVVRLKEIDTTIRVPEKVLEVASENPELTRAEKISAISASSWARGWSEGMCRLVTGEARPECVDRLSRRLAEKVVE